MAARHMTMAQLERTPEWGRLSVQQRFWLVSYLRSGADKTFAANCAYDVSPTNSRKMGHYVLHNKKVQAALAVYKGARQIFLDKLQKDIEASKPGSATRTKLQTLMASLAFEINVPSNPSKKSKTRKSRRK